MVPFEDGGDDKKESFNDVSNDNETRSPETRVDNGCHY